MRDLEALLRWAEKIATDFPIIGFAVMGFAGGIVATIRLYERAGMEMTARMLIGRLVVKVFMGTFVSLLVFLGWRALGWKMEWGFIAAAVGGIFSAEVLDVVFVSGVQWLRGRAGLGQDMPPPPPPPTGR